ncbi:MAG: DUF1624 domain-containing protein [Hyphomicrobiales bacterium]|nr:DUF1624 domain-containing protein [Hyphomicrobiales bacterium]
MSPVVANPAFVSTPVAPPRQPVLDAARGLAILAMVSFHATWDLAYFGFIPADFPDRPWFRLYGHMIASSFLTLVGVGLVLAFRKADPWPRYWQRITKIAIAASLITLVTHAIMPDAFIFFGILHCIVLCSLVGVLFVRASLGVRLGTMAVAFALPLWIASPALDAPAFWWLGLGTHLPVSNDIQPFLPWFGMVMAGMVLAESNFAQRFGAVWAQRLRPTRLRAGLAGAGRHSLGLYMLHQPLLFAILYPLTLALGPAAPPDSHTLVGQCEIQCVNSGRDAPACHRGCTCFADQIKQHGLWDKAQLGRLNAVEQKSIIGFANQCVRAQDVPETLGND